MNADKRRWNSLPQEQTEVTEMKPPLPQFLLFEILCVLCVEKRGALSPENTSSFNAEDAKVLAKDAKGDNRNPNSPVKRQPWLDPTPLRTWRGRLRRAVKCE